MRLGKLLFVLALFLGAYPAFASAEAGCISPLGGDMPFPLGSKAPIPWDDVDGYWTDYGGNKYFYRIEVIDTFKDGSRNVVVSLMNDEATEIAANGMGFVRANAMDLWARVKGQDIDLKIRIQAFFPKGKTDMTKRILMATVTDLADPAPPCVVRHALKKVTSLDNGDQVVNPLVTPGHSSALCR